MSVANFSRSANKLQDARATAGAFLREWWRPLLTAIALCSALIIFEPSGQADRLLSDKLLVAQAKPASPELLIVEIGPEDARKYQGPPISRAALARMLERLAQGNAERVLIDIYLGVPLTPESDGKLAAAMARLGPDRLGLVTAPLPTDLPFVGFARHASVLDARLSPDGDGWHRRMAPSGAAKGYNAARWLADNSFDTRGVDFDLRINPAGIERLSADDVISRPADYSGRTVVISISSVFSPSRAFLPAAKRADRATVIAVAVQSLRDGYVGEASTGRAANWVLIGLAMVLGFVIAATAGSWRSLAALAVATVVTLGSASISVGMQLAGEVHPTVIIGCFFTMGNITLLHRLKILPMVASFMHGDVSPEEAWAWRSCEHSYHPVLLFGADGRIKRSNPEGGELIAREGERLAAMCMPRLGYRAESLMLDSGNGKHCSFELDWPYEGVPIVVLRDVTEADAVERSLRQQLMTDELTGILNRRGFEYAVNSAGLSGELFALFFIDMNGFKAINDTHGHDAGDEYLVITAKRLTALFRSEDTVARLGGDEFVVLAPALGDEVSARRTVERIVAALGAPTKLSANGAIVTAGAAVGHAVRSDSAEDPSEVIRRADQAMYRRKQQDKALRRVA